VEKSGRPITKFVVFDQEAADVLRPFVIYVQETPLSGFDFGKADVLENSDLASWLSVFGSVHPGPHRRPTPDAIK